ncbi:MAG: ATP-binding protein [Rhodocyclaceae bacterium]|nr:ATP-binding protein [Rhodocyclaceae bacterium]MDZ4214570.1 ATP-binding protein [Rhodocyclaceae bacterium]
MRLIALILLFSLCIPAAQAATVALDTQAERMDLSNNIALLHDPRGEFHFSEVAAMESEFRAVARKDLLQSFNAGVFWLRVSLLHSGSQPVTRWLVVGTAKINAVTLYLQNGQDWQVMRSGRNVALAEKPIVATDAVFPLTLLPGGNRQVLIRVEARGATDMGTTLWEPQAYRFTAGNRMLGTVAMLSGVLVSAMLALLVFIRLRQARYLWLCLMLIGIAGVEAARKNLIGLYLWPADQTPPLQVLAVFAGLAVFSLSRVVASALDTAQQLPVADKLLAILGWFAVFATLLCFFSYGVGVRLLAIDALILHLTSLILPLLLWRRGYAPARWFAATFSLGLLVETARQLANLGILPWSDAMNFSLVGFLLAAPLILLGMVEQTRQLSERLVVAEQLQQAKSAFLARVSHELRSPLNTILGFARMLQRGSARLSLDEGTRGIEKGALRLLDLIDELLDESRAAAGKLAVSPAPTSFNPWLDELCAGATVACEAQGNRFVGVRSGSPPLAVAIDAQRLRQVLENLINNANRHTHQGEIRLECSTQIDDQSGVLSFAVLDNGEGISAQHLPTIFEPFVRGDEAKVVHREKRTGYGLGLSICRELVRQMGGEITVSSELGRGSRFSFTLRCPLATPPAEEVRRVTPSPLLKPVTPQSTRAGPRVLLVDDDPLQLKLLVDLLEDAGFVTQTADSGEAAVGMVRGQTWAAVITDQMMARGHGWFVLEQVRGCAPALPVILLSAALPDRPDDVCGDIEFDAVLRKPALSEVLLATLWAVVLKVGAGETAPSATQWQELATLAGDGDVSGIEDWIAAVPVSPVTAWVRAALNRLDFDLLQRSAMIVLCQKK